LKQRCCCPSLCQPNAFYWWLLPAYLRPLPHFPEHPPTGYLPSFWIKLRLLSIPAVNSAPLAVAMPVLLGGPTHLTVGLIAAFVAVACIIAADTGAYFCGKAFGRTQVRLLPTGWKGT
jgi:CDP-diglyceride synthetase